MKRQLTAILTIISLMLAIEAKADSWEDPSWKEMLDSSEVIALIQYTSDGDFRASAKIITVYKGLLKMGDEIWVSGFSNRYGPIDKMSVGDKYFVFLTLSEPTEKRLEYWSEELLKNPEIKDYVEALKNKKAYYVWTPTSGDLKVKENKVQYDLVQTTFYKKQNFYPLSEFETFLRAYFDNTLKSQLSKKLLNSIKSSKQNNPCSQTLMKLYLLGYNEYDDIFEKYATNNSPSAKYALAQLMGNMNNEQSKRVLLTLLKDKHSLVQSEAVRQLSKNFPNEIGAVLLEQLKKANPYNFESKDIMNPVMNRTAGGKSQIIETLGNIGYKSAIPELLTMLETKDHYEFEHIVRTLRKLETKEYASYINKHLENLEDRMVLTLCIIIREDSLTECIPSLMNYIKRHDKTIHPTKEYAIRYLALPYFKTDNIIQFLYADFLDLLKMPSTNKQSIDTKQKWVSAYISGFISLGISEPKSLIYDCMYDYYGFNSNFKSNPELFRRKYEIEDSLANVIKKVLIPIDSNVTTTAFTLIDNDFNIVDYVIRYQINIPFELNRRHDEEINQIIFNNTGIDKRHLICSAKKGGTFIYGGLNICTYSDGPLRIFLDYISTFADDEDILFIENLKRYHYAKSDYEKEQFDKYLLKAKTNLEQ